MNIRRTTVTLGEVITLQRGFDLPERVRAAGNVPIVSSSGITGYHAEAKVTAPGVVTGRYGTLGEVFYLKEDFWPLNTTLWVKDFKGNCPLFVSYLLRTLHLGTHNAAGAVPGLNRNALHLLPVRVPPRSIQERIASILSAYDDLIENNSRRITILEDIAQMIYREWFVNFRFPGYEKVKKVESVIGSIPAAWDVKTLDQVMDFQGGSQPPKSQWIEEDRDGFVRMIQIRDYQSDSYKCYVRDSKTLRKCGENDIMIARYGASVARICWGLEGAYNVALVRVVPVSSHFKEFLRSYLQSDTFQALLIGMSGRTAQAGFNKSNLTSIRLAIPKDESLLVAYEKVLAPVRDLILTLRKATKTASKTRDFLLPKLISGQISVEHSEIGAVAQGV